MESLNDERAYVELLLDDAPAGVYAVKLASDPYTGEPLRYRFVCVDDNGEVWPLGSASYSTEREVYEGYIDSKRIIFDGSEELQRIVAHRPGYAYLRPLMVV